VEQKTMKETGRNKISAVLMFEKEDENTIEMENFNYDKDQHSLIDESEFINDIDDLDPAFIKDVCEILGEED
jgi:predicted ThiF/HesA family dinucleotide-utilizing enzyme